MARRVNEIQLVDLPVLGGIVNLNRPGLNGNAALPLQVHVVQELIFHFPLGHRLADFQQPVRQRGFPMVDVGDDGEVSNFTLIVHIWYSLLRKIHLGVFPMMVTGDRPLGAEARKGVVTPRRSWFASYRCCFRRDSDCSQ